MSQTYSSDGVRIIRAQQQRIRRTAREKAIAIVTRLKLKNWRNFRDADVPLHERTYLFGANASGKSNLLDVFRFLRDVSKSQGGGLQKAIHDRGGIKKLRRLHARKDPEVRIELQLANSSEDETPEWRYVPGFKQEGQGAHRTLISEEQVWRGETLLLSRPDKDDQADLMRLTQTAIEQIQVNVQFRDLAAFFSETTYLHLVPQLLKYSKQIGGQRLEEDPFGQGFLERIAKKFTWRGRQVGKSGNACAGAEMVTCGAACRISPRWRRSGPCWS